MREYSPFALILAVITWMASLVPLFFLPEEILAKDAWTFYMFAMIFLIFVLVLVSKKSGKGIEASEGILKPYQIVERIWFFENSRERFSAKLRFQDGEERIVSMKEKPSERFKVIYEGSSKTYIAYPPPGSSK